MSEPVLVADVQGLPQTKEELFQRLKEMDQPFTVDDLADVLGKTVRHDNDNKVITFLGMLLTFTEEDQVNLGFLAESSSGKSYIPLELSWYFPSDAVIKLGYASPQTFFYENGLLINDPSDTRDVEDEKRQKIRVVDLHQKILIFMDQPHDVLLQRLRSLLSHDERKIVSKFVNKRERSGNRTETVIMEGFPTVIFCSAKFTMQDQEKTRLLLLSPEINQEKLRESIILKIDKESDREAFKKKMDEDPKRRLLAGRVDEIRLAGVKYITVPEDLRNDVYNRFMGAHNFLIPRHQRDISRLLAIIKGHALLNYMHRQRTQDSISANKEDVDAGFELYERVSEANELGLSPEVYHIFEEVKGTVGSAGITIAEFQVTYFNKFHKRLGYGDSRRILKTLASVGLLSEISDTIDKRVRRYILLECGPQENADSTPAKNIVTIPETLENLRNNLEQPFNEGKAVELIAQIRRCAPAEAEKAFVALVDDGKLFRDSEGLWRFG